MKRNVSHRPGFREALAALCLAGALLTGCAAGNTGAKLRVDHIGLPALGAAPVAPVVIPSPCPAELRAPAPAEPVLPDDAYFPRPETTAAAEPTSRYFAWLHAHEDWARALLARATIAIAYCGAP